MIDLLDGDWSYQIPGGRPQLSRAREWFNRQQFTSSENLEQSLSGLTARQIALACVYQGIKVTRLKAEQLASKAPQTSDKKIYEQYLALHKDADRLNVEGKKKDYLIKDIETVIGILSGPAKKRAESELFELE